MAWLRSRTERSTGLTTWSIEWREGGRGRKVRARVLGAITEKEAQYELAAMNAGKKTRRTPTQTGTPKQAVKGYIQHLRASGRRQGTLDHDADKLKPLLDTWGHRPLSEWSRPMLEALLAERGWSTSRVRQALGVYRRFIAWCRAVGYGCGDFVNDFKPPRARPQEHREALSADQCRRLLDEARGHYLEVPVALALLTGLSRADLRAITWKEVDLARGYIVRLRSKTGRPLRLPMSEPLKEVLKRHRERSGPVCRRLPKSDSWLSLRGQGRTAATTLPAVARPIANGPSPTAHRPIAFVHGGTPAQQDKG